MGHSKVLSVFDPLTYSSHCSQKNAPNSMGSTPPGLIFMGISSPFKLHNIINGSEQEEQRIPQRQQEIAAVVSSAGSLDLKAFMLQTKKNSKLKNVISGFSLSQ